MSKDFEIIINGADNPTAVTNNRSISEFNVFAEEKRANKELMSYRNAEGTVSVITDKRKYGAVTVQQNTIRNMSNEPFVISRISSAYIENICPIADETDIVIHYCTSCWQGEGQWHTATLRDFGITDVTHHSFNRTSKSIGSIGSWSTSRYYPLIVIEDKKENMAWFFEHEGGFSWEIELGFKGHGAEACLCVDVNSANENHSGFFVNLAPGEEYVTSVAVYGCADGGFEEAVYALLNYKRELSPQSLAFVCFNDYMNCLWAKPNYENTIPLIDKAAEVGAEIYCIDDGWFKRDDEYNFGDWIENDSIFGSLGFEGIIKYIIQKGMKPGIWLELETCMQNSKISKLNENCLLKRHGKVIGYDRYFLNFSDESVRGYLLRVIDKLYSYGIRYIKNDYNHTMGIGCENYSDSFAYGIMQNTKAFYSFIDDIKNKYKDLIIENCGSGAMRSDNGTLKRFDLQSVSDQESYYNTPSIIWGMSACMPPEKMGIWSMPYPMGYYEQEKGHKLFDKDYVKRRNDGEETIFNMACAMFGSMCLSGHIDYCDKYNTDLIKEGISVYKKIRTKIKKAKPVYIYPQLGVSENGYSVLALEMEENSLLIGVFKVNAENDVLKINLKNRLSNSSKIHMIYPNKITKYSLENGVIKMELLGKYSARVFEITNLGLDE